MTNSLLSWNILGNYAHVNALLSFELIHLKYISCHIFWISYSFYWLVLYPNFAVSLTSLNIAKVSLFTLLCLHILKQPGKIYMVLLSTSCLFSFLH